LRHGVYAQLYTELLFVAYSASRTILTVIDHMQEYIFPDFSFFPDFTRTTL